MGQEKRGYTTAASDGGEKRGRKEGDILEQLQMGGGGGGQERRGYTRAASDGGEKCGQERRGDRREASSIQMGEQSRAGKKWIYMY